MEISAQKTIPMTNSANGFQRDINLKEQKLGTVTGFGYLRAGFRRRLKMEGYSRIAQATAALTMLKSIERNNNVSFRSEVTLMRPHVKVHTYVRL